MSYDPASTAILLVDPYNDFLSEGGKPLAPRERDRRGSETSRSPA